MRHGPAPSSHTRTRSTPQLGEPFLSTKPESLRSRSSPMTVPAQRRMASV
jgi:hypothetical protein